MNNPYLCQKQRRVLVPKIHEYTGLTAEAESKVSKIQPALSNLELWRMATWVWPTTVAMMLGVIGGDIVAQKFESKDGALVYLVLISVITALLLSALDSLIGRLLIRRLRLLLGDDKKLFAALQTTHKWVAERLATNLNLPPSFTEGGTE